MNPRRNLTPSMLVIGLDIGPSLLWSHAQHYPMRDGVLNVICTIHCFNPKRRCHVLGLLNHAVDHLFQCSSFSFNTLLLRGVGNKVLMLNAKFSIKLFECLINTLIPIICACFIYIKRRLLLNKIFEGL